MNTYKRLASDTAIYGVSSILGRVINWFLTPYYTFVLHLPAEFGIQTNLYAYSSILLVLLTYGMETSFFRYASRSDEPQKVYSTSLYSILLTTLLFLIAVFVLKGNIAGWIGYGGNPEYIAWMAIILAIDSFTAIPFAYLRLTKRPVRFAVIRTLNIVLTIIFNLFFFSLCPYLLKNNPDSIVNLIYSEKIGVGYIFISNLMASAIMLLMLLPYFIRVKPIIDKKILKSMLKYGFPILIVGITGMISQNIEKILIPVLMSPEQDPITKLGIYGACFKIAVLMNMFIQAFRYSFEPYFFSSKNSKEDPEKYAKIMKYFVVFGLIIFLGMVLYIDIVKIIIKPTYYEGLKIVPLILMGNLFLGIYFTQSFWYKITDKTQYGAYQGIIGAVITIVLNVILVPYMGYMGSAIAQFVCFFTITVISYVAGQKYYPVPYDLKRLGTYFLIAGILYFLSVTVSEAHIVIKYAYNTILFISFFAIVFILENNELKKLFTINIKK